MDDKKMRDICLVAEEYIQQYNNLKRYQSALSIEVNPTCRRFLSEKITDYKTFVEENAKLLQEILNNQTNLI